MIPTMILADWRNWNRRHALLTALPERVWCLINCEIAQTVQHLCPTDRRPQEAIDARRAWCLGPCRMAKVAMVRASRSAADMVDSLSTRPPEIRAAPPEIYAAWAASVAARARAARVAWAAAEASARAEQDFGSYPTSYAIYRAALPIRWNPEWSTRDVCGLARGIWDDPRQTLSWAMLADALQDAGCDNILLLRRLRGKRTVLTRADVAVRVPLGLCDESESEGKRRLSYDDATT